MKHHHYKCFLVVSVLAILVGACGLAILRSRSERTTSKEAVLAESFSRQGTAIASFLLEDCDPDDFHGILCTRLRRFSEDVLSNPQSSTVGWTWVRAETQPVANFSDFSRLVSKQNAMSHGSVFRIVQRGMDWHIDTRIESSNEWCSLGHAPRADELAPVLSVAMLRAIRTEKSGKQTCSDVKDYAAEIAKTCQQMERVQAILDNPGNPQALDVNGNPITFVAVPSPPDANVSDQQPALPADQK